MRKKTSPIWKMEKQLFQELVKRSHSYTDILKEFGFNGSGGSGLTLKQRIKEENIDCSHILSNNKGRKFPYRRAIPLNKVMVKNSTYSRYHLKARLIKEKILKNECAICKQIPYHNGKRLVLVLDHINGINNDHRLENLRLLCPNCNSQTDTFSGKRNKKRYNCKKCGIIIGKYSKLKLCKSCYGISCVPKKVKNRPSVKRLLQEIKKTNYCAVGRKYGVSDNTIRKWIKY